MHKLRFGLPEISRRNSIQKKRSVRYVNRRDWTARACNRLLVVVICGRGMDYARESVTCIIAVVVIHILPTRGIVPIDWLLGRRSRQLSLNDYKCSTVIRLPPNFNLSLSLSLI